MKTSGWAKSGQLVRSVCGIVILRAVTLGPFCFDDQTEQARRFRT